VIPLEESVASLGEVGADHPGGGQTTRVTPSRG